MINFHIPLIPQPSPIRIHLRDTIVLAGSCFSEHMAERFRMHKFSVFENPHGILFNPVSLATSLKKTLDGARYEKSDLFHHEGLWSSWDHHSHFSDSDPDKALLKMNASLENAHHYLRKCKWLILTLGTAYVYQLKDSDIVGNCHKVPNTAFSRRLLSAGEVIETLSGLIQTLSTFNPSCRVVLTISPVRHLRDGFVENNRSKAMLINATHSLCEMHDHVEYFPAYELVIDDLRDYRFYTEDMVHPNHLATEYVWERFSQAWITPESRELMKEIALLRTAMAHKPMHPDSEPHRVFRKKFLQQAIDLANRLPWIDFSSELEFFSA